jgi:hypothetical protein
MMKKSISPKITHLGIPKDTKFIDHICEVIEVDNIHKYQMRCVTCDKYVKWASELEYLWVMSRPKLPSFRKLFWAPRYCDDFSFINQEIYKDKLKEIEFLPRGNWL